MNKTTEEIINSINVLVKFNENMAHIMAKFPEIENDIDLLKSYVSYEIKKTLRDIIHIERL